MKKILLIISILFLGQTAFAADFNAFPKWQHVIDNQPLVLGAAYNVDLETINEHYNHQIKFKSDVRIDYWQTPGETLALGTGDCEDYAIIKYYDLAAKGINPDDMMIVVGSYNGELHSVLKVGSRILDNQSDKIIAASKYKMNIAYGINHSHWTRTP